METATDELQVWTLESKTPTSISFNGAGFGCGGSDFASVKDAMRIQSVLSGGEKVYMHT